MTLFKDKKKAITKIMIAIRIYEINLRQKKCLVKTRHF